jgi:hypothetical protein
LLTEIISAHFSTQQRITYKYSKFFKFYLLPFCDFLSLNVIFSVYVIAYVLYFVVCFVLCFASLG